MWWCCSCKCSFATRLVYSEHLLCAHEEVFPQTRVHELPIGYTYTLTKTDDEATDEITDTETNLVCLKPLALAKLKPCSVVAKRFDLESEHVFSIGTGLSVVFTSSLLKETTECAVDNVDIPATITDSSICPQCDQIKQGADHQCSFNVQKFSCEFCWQPFWNADNLISHLKLCQSRADKFFCEECGRAFKKKHKLNIHRGGQNCRTKFAEFKKENQVIQFLPMKKPANPITGNTLETSLNKSYEFGLDKKWSRKNINKKKAKVKFTKTHRRRRPLNLVVPVISVTNKASKIKKVKKLSESSKPNCGFKHNNTPETAFEPNQNLPWNGFEFLRNSVEEFYGQNVTANDQIGSPKTNVEPNLQTWKPIRYPTLTGIKQEVKAEPINGLCTDIISAASLEGPDGILFCAECGLPCADLDNLRKHVMKAKHETVERQVTVVVRAGKKFYECKICSRSFQKLDKAYFHAFLHVYPENIRVMSEKKVFRCTIKRCEASFNTDTQLSAHQAEHKRNGTLYGTVNYKKQKFKCQFCPRFYQIESTLRTHEQREHSTLLNATNPTGLPGLSNSIPGANKRVSTDLADNTDVFNSHSSKKIRLDGIKLALNGYNCCTAFSNHHNQSDDARVLHDEECQRDRACLLCSTILNSKEELSDHYRLKHRNASIAGYQCQICKFQTASYIAFSQHVKNTHQAFFVCHMPEYGITQVVKSDLNVVQNLFTCDNCRQSFANFSRLRLHKIVAENLTCKHCKQQCCTPADLVKHTKQRHPSQLPKLKTVQYVCKPCKKGYQSREKYTNHVAFHFSDTYNCVFCHELLLTNDELDGHLETQHFGKIVSADFDLDKLKCPECQLQQATLTLLKLHVYSAHFNTNVFVCDCAGCLKVFRVKSHLESHTLKEHSSHSVKTGQDKNDEIEVPLTAVSKMVPTSRKNGIQKRKEDESSNTELSVFSVEPRKIDYSTKPNLIFLD